MAQKKKKSIVQQPKTSPKKYIETRARQLPIGKCLINSGWEESRMASICVGRRHVNGNYTAAIYLVDLLARGVKDTVFFFNMPEFKLDEILSDEADHFVPCEYNLAHNIIYGAVAFAEEFGMNPHKDFKVSEHILEEDDEDVPLMDIAFGVDGKPVFMDGAGPDFDGLEEEDLDDLTDEDLLDFTDWFISSGADHAYGKIFVDTDDVFYLERIRQHERLTISEDTIDPLDENENEEAGKIYDALNELIHDRNKEQTPSLIRAIEKKIGEYPKTPVFLNYLANAYLLSGDESKAGEVLEDCFKKFPDYLIGRFFYANHLLMQNKADKVLGVLEGHHDIQLAAPDRVMFHAQEVYLFYGLLCHYYVSQEDYSHARPYYELIRTAEDDGLELPWDHVQLAKRAMVQYKIDKLEKFYNKPFADILIDMAPS